MYDITKEQIAKQLKNNEPINLRFKFIDEDLCALLKSTIVRILSYRDQLFLLDSLITILREIILNAIKANAKRVFFEKNNIDITDSNGYRTGMGQFRDKVIDEFYLIQPDLETSNYYALLNINNDDNILTIKITNNVTIVTEEFERINFRINKAKSLNNLTEFYEEIQDETEGAGLGIVLTIFLLKNMGIDPDNFTILSTGDTTLTTLKIPMKLRSDQIVSPVKEYILNEIEGIPTFPRKILDLLHLCENPESSIDQISQKIELDPALASDVIKLSNSAGFISNKKIESINEAVMTIGLKNVKAILITSNSRKILNERYNNYEKIWEHCNRTAYYARQIAIKNRLTKILENVFISGLLHDLGKIILLATDRELIKRIANLVNNRKIITSTIMEEISIGLSHSTIGALISKKWNFPEYLVETIQCHHAPLNAKPQYKNLVNTVYLANMICNIETGQYSYDYIDESILKQFELDDEKKFGILNEELKESYAALYI